MTPAGMSDPFTSAVLAAFRDQVIDDRAGIFAAVPVHTVPDPDKSCAFSD